MVFVCPERKTISLKPKECFIEQHRNTVYSQNVLYIAFCGTLFYSPKCGFEFYFLITILKEIMSKTLSKTHKRGTHSGKKKTVKKNKSVS